MTLFAMDLYEIGEGRVLPELADELSGIHRALDLWCGRGEWVIATARKYPNMEVHGIDTHTGSIEAAAQQARLAGLGNASFSVLDPLHVPMPDESVDLVNARFVVDTVSLESWPLLVREGLRLLRPGGILRLTEADSPITVGSATERLNALLSQALWLVRHNLFPETTSGQKLLITPRLGRSLRDAGCLDIHQTAFFTNFSHGMPAHTAISQNLTTIYQDAIPFLLEQQVATQEEIESLQAQMLSEMQAASFNAGGFYLTVNGKKP
jgi:ubiquinone/menaquinone biosynthesis C-methylase UbiE